jgi:hypothetical protein
LELIFSRVLFKGLRLFWTRPVARHRFIKESNRILDQIQSMDEERGRRPVLVKRLLGLEDSSRYWSPFMALEHMVTVDRSIMDVMEELYRSPESLSEIRIADLKPQRTTGSEMVSIFQRTVGDFVVRLDRLPDLRTPARHAHPWFGPLNGHGWLCMAAMHHIIHRRQLEHILRA